MPVVRRANVLFLCLAALILLCSVPLLLQAPAIDVTTPRRGPAKVDAVNWELIKQVISTHPPRDPRFRGQLGQDEWVSRHRSGQTCLHAGAHAPATACDVHLLDLHTIIGMCLTCLN